MDFTNVAFSFSIMLSNIGALMILGSFAAIMLFKVVAEVFKNDKEGK